MTELQSIQLDMLRCFVSVCEQLGLTYYLVCGSALGAVKYNGFIPWDDDVDVALPRKDYKIFCEKAQDLLPSWCFLQTYRTDPVFPAFYCKLRDSRTTFVEKGVEHLRINHGVYIDVFPLDGYPSDTRDVRRLERKKRLLKLLLASAYSTSPTQKPLTRVALRLLRVGGIHRLSGSIAGAIERLISCWDTEDSPVWCNHGNWQGRLEYAPREQYGDGVEALFEGVTVRVPAQYDAYLTQKYGDWRADLPLDQQIGHHTCAVFDLHKSYLEYR